MESATLSSLYPDLPCDLHMMSDTTSTAQLGVFPAIVRWALPHYVSTLGDLKIDHVLAIPQTNEGSIFFKCSLGSPVSSQVENQ
jgi:hypothetical protein